MPKAVSPCLVPPHCAAEARLGQPLLVDSAVDCLSYFSVGGVARRRDRTGGASYIPRRPYASAAAARTAALPAAVVPAFERRPLLHLYLSIFVPAFLFSLSVHCPFHPFVVPSRLLQAPLKRKKNKKIRFYLNKTFK